MKTHPSGTSTLNPARWWITHAHITSHKYTLPIKAWTTETWTTKQA